LVSYTFPRNLATLDCGVFYVGLRGFRRFCDAELRGFWWLGIIKPRKICGVFCERFGLIFSGFVDLELFKIKIISGRPFPAATDNDFNLAELFEFPQIVLNGPRGFEASITHDRINRGPGETLFWVVVIGEGEENEKGRTGGFRAFPNVAV